MLSLPVVSDLNHSQSGTVRARARLQELPTQYSSDRSSVNATICSSSQSALAPEAIVAITLLPVFIIAIALGYRTQRRIIHHQKIHRLERLWQLKPPSNSER